MKELNEKLLKFAGFEFVLYPNHKGDTDGEWFYPDSSFHFKSPNFTESFDDCLKWLVPKLIYINIYYDKKLGFAVFVDGGEVCYDKTGDNLAPAFCLAVEKLIEKTND